MPEFVSCDIVSCHNMAVSHVWGVTAECLWILGHEWSEAEGLIDDKLMLNVMIHESNEDISIIRKSHLKLYQTCDFFAPKR